ncbi:MAG: hypothetical protein WCV73_00430 [Patescibacteria group bacterium]
MMVLTAFGTFGFALTTTAANVAVPGDLITASNTTAVYYLDSNLKRHPFHHANQYFTWYKDFSSVKTVSTDELSGYDLGSTIVVRPGTKLVQFVSLKADGGFSVDDPKVYAVGTNGTIMHVDSAATAVKFFGSSWESQILGLPNFLYGYYTVGAQLTSSSNYPTGSLVKTAASSQTYYIDGSTKRPVTDAGFTANRFNMAFVQTASDLSGYSDGSSVTSMESALAAPMAGSGSATPISGSGLTVALASDTPGDQTVPGLATNVPLMKINLTAAADGAVTLNTLSVKRLGIGSSAQYTNLYLYDGATRLTNGKTLNSTTNMAQFVNIGLAIPAGSTKTLTLSADTGATATYSGHFSYFQVNSTDITSTAVVNGSFPIVSKTTSIGSANSGDVEIDKDGTLSNPSVGQLNAKIAQFKLSAGTGEDLTIKRITLYEAGTLNNAYLSNLSLYQLTTKLASVSSVNAKGYVVFDLATPFTLAKNTNRIFYVYADINGAARNTDTIRTYLDQTTDLYAVGATYGYGATVDMSTSGTDTGTYDGTSTYYSEVTVQGGQFTVTMDGPIAGNVAAGATNVSLMNFGVTSKVNAEIRSLRVELSNSGAAGANLDKTAADTTADDCSNDYITNVKVVDTDNGESTSAVNCSSFTGDLGTGAGVYNTFTDYFTLTANVTRHFAIKADLHSSLTAATYFATLGSSVTSFYTFGPTAIKNTDNNQFVTDIAPSTFSQGTSQTVAAADLYVSLASGTPSAGTTIIQGTNKVTLAEFALKALSGSSVTISGMTMYGYVDGDGAGATSSMAVGSVADVREAGMAAVGTVYANNLVTNLRIYDKSADSALATNLNGSLESMSTAGLVTFSDMNWTIPAGETKILAVVGDVTSSAFANGDTGGEGTTGMSKYVKMNFKDNTGITAVDASNNSVTMKNSTGGAYVITSGNGSATAVTSSTYIVIAESGTLNVTADSNPDAANVVASTLNVPVLNLKFQATNEAFNVNKLRIEQKEAATNDRSVTSVTIKYTNKDNTIVFATQQLISGVADFNITANPLYVPIGSKVVNVYFNLAAINQNTAAYTGDVVSAMFDEDSNFEAKGAGSSRTSITSVSNASSIVDVPGNLMVVHGTLPVFTADETGGNLAGGVNQLYKFQVTANEGTDLTLKKLSFKLGMTDVVKDTSTLYLSNFEILEGDSYNAAAALTQADTGAKAYQIYNGWGATTTVATGVLGGKLSDANSYLYQNTALNSAAAGSGASSTNDVILVFNQERVISSGQSKYYILTANVGHFETGTSSNGDAVWTYLFNGDTASNTTTGYKYLKANCVGNSPSKAQSKYCLSSNANGAESTGSYMIWSDSTGVNGNLSHTDLNASSTYDGTAVTKSADWFNGYNIKTLNKSRSLN